VRVVTVANGSLETVKPVDDDPGDVIVRVYEARRTARRCTLTTRARRCAAQQTDLLEAVAGDRPCAAGQGSFSFRPLEIRAFRLRR